MKKLMMTTVAALGFAVCAQAADDGVLNKTGFEDYGSNSFKVNATDTGATEGDQFWTGDGSADFSQTVLKTYAEAAEAPANVPDAFTNAANTTFLSVDTGNAVMCRRAAANPTETIDLSSAGPVFFDADVKFTASETAVVPSEGDKLLVWLKGDETTTNLIVTAGLYNGTSGEYDKTPFIIDGDYSADTWYRLTVKATRVLSGDEENYTTAFNVYIDGKLVTSDGTDLFYSLVQQTDKLATTIAEAGFQGTGALDNVVWTTTDPFPPEGTYTLAFTGDEGFVNEMALVTVDGANVESAESFEKAGIGVSVKEVTVVAQSFTKGTVTPTTEAEGVTFSKVTMVETEETDPENPEESWTVYTYTFTVTVAEPAVGANYAIALAFAVGGDDVPTAGEAAAGGSATVKAADADAAAGAVTVTVDSAVAAALTAEQKATFVASFFTKSVVDNQDGTFTVSVAVNGEAVEAKLDEVVAEALETAADGKITTIPAGLCYKIESGSTVGLGTVAKGVSTGATIAVEGLSAEAGFYKVSLDVAPIAE